MAEEHARRRSLVRLIIRLTTRDYNIHMVAQGVLSRKNVLSYPGD